MRTQRVDRLCSLADKQVARPKNLSPDLLELWLNLGDAHHQAARVSASSVTSTPSVNLIPSMTFGNWFLPLRRSHFFEAA